VGHRPGSPRPLLLIVAGLVTAAVALAPWVGARVGVPVRFWGERIATVHVGPRALRVVVTAENERGLMGVDDLGALDGMLFDFPDPLTAPDGMWMRDVPIPLDVAFFATDGRLTDVVTMPTCDATCPIHTSSRPARWATEGRAGDFAGLPLGAVLGR
jgi:uncharacterized membrane protein (UPF0127 family)